MTDIEIVDVTARDGLQNESRVLPPRVRADLVRRLVENGTRRFEVASFVHPKRVPQMADAETVVAHLPDCADAQYIGLCLNLRGAERAVAASQNVRHGIDEIGCVIVASDTFGLRNQGQTIDDTLSVIPSMLRFARDNAMTGQVTISAAWGCPFEGEVSEATVLRIADALLDHEPSEIALADTIGVATPDAVESLFHKLRDLVPDHIPLRAHFHDTRGMAVANVIASMRAGIRIFDASLGGTGGCPFAPAATGNISVEDLLYLFERDGHTTGIDLDSSLETNAWLSEHLGFRLPSRVARAGGRLIPQEA